VTLNVCPAIVTVPVRDDVTAFAKTLIATVPFPLPVEPDVTLIQAALVRAVQLHPVAAVTVTLSGPPLDPIVAEVGLIE
jgi:hypothetical protein